MHTMNASRVWKLAPAAALSAALLLPWPCLGQGTEAAPSDPAALRGSKALMADWNARKIAARDKVLAILRTTGALPENGAVTFTASVRPSPGNPDAFDVVVETLSVAPAPAPKSAGASEPRTGIEAAMAPRDISSVVETRALSARDSGAITDRLVIRNGRVTP